MKKIAFSLFTALVSLFLVLPTPVEASGLKLIKNGDTYYLSTTEENDKTVTTTTYQVVAADSTTSAKTTAATPQDMTPIDPPTGYTEDFGQLLNFLLQLVIVIGILLVFFNLIMAGLQWITSGGDKGKTDAARQRIIAALVGILVLSAAFAVAQLVAYILGFDSFNEIFYSIKRINP